MASISNINEQTERAAVKLNTGDKRVSQTALKAFFNISRDWQLSTAQQQVLLGQPARSTFYKWRNGEGPILPKDTLERISYILGIYKALRLLLPSQSQADAWPHKSNSDFAGSSALEHMLKGNVLHLADVRRYLDARRG